MNNHPSDVTDKARPPYFFSLFRERLFRSQVAQDIGQPACLLLVYLSTMEEQRRAPAPVLLWTSQVMTDTGFTNRKSLEAARQRAVDGGWLAYQAHHTERAGAYRISIPLWARD
jgi:hypothetical protein